MSSFKVTVERLAVLPHPNADRLELAQVGGYRAVVAKGQYVDGDLAVYIPEQAILPDGLIEELGLKGKLGGKEGNRVCAVRLRGQLSQGVVCLPKRVADQFPRGSALSSAVTLDLLHARKDDLAEYLGIRKWVPEVPSYLQGTVQSAPDLVRWLEDIPNVQRYPGIIKPGELVVATEKVHGVAHLSTFDAASARFYVSSKGLGDQRLSFEYGPRNLHWQMAEYYALGLVAGYLARRLKADKVALFGELFGKGVQDLGYGRSDLDYVLYDVAVVTNGRKEWISHMDIHELVGGQVPVVPLLYRGVYDEEELREIAQGQTVVGNGAHIREGIVVRPALEQLTESGDRAIVKFINPAYVLRENGTEYE